MMEKYINKTVTILFPLSCPVCWENIVRYPEIICGGCARKLREELDITFRSSSNIKNILSCSKNSGRMKILLKVFKYRKKQAVKLLIPFLEKTVLYHNKYFADIDIVIPVPVHKRLSSFVCLKHRFIISG